MTAKPETASEVLAEMRSTKALFAHDWADRLERVLSAPSDGELVQRLLLHAEMHENVSPHDAEQAQWERDLREAARLLSAQGEAVAWRLVGTERRMIEPDVPEGQSWPPPPYEWETVYRWQASIEAITADGNPPSSTHPAPARVTEEMVERARKAYWRYSYNMAESPNANDDNAMRAALTAALEADHG